MGSMLWLGLPAAGVSSDNATPAGGLDAIGEVAGKASRLIGVHETICQVEVSSRELPWGAHEGGSDS